MSQGQEGYGTCGVRVHPKVTWCVNCIFAYYRENLPNITPDKGCCGIYYSKPNKIYFDGEKCDFWVEQTDLNVLKRYSEHVKKMNKMLVVKMVDPFEHLFND